MRIACTYRRLGACDAARPPFPPAPHLPSRRPARARRTAHGMTLIYTPRSRQLQAPSAPLQPRCSRTPPPRRGADHLIWGARPCAPRARGGGDTAPTPLVQITDRANFFCLAAACLSRATRSWSICPTTTHVPSQAQTHTVRAPA